MTAAYLALDPGETTGWATFKESGDVLAFGQFKQKDQTAELTRLVESTLKAVICEEYRNYGHMQQKKWSRNQTSKNEGAIELMCELRQVPFFLQPASVKKIGYMWMGLGAAPSNHDISHQYDAIVHGGYWLIKNGIVLPNHYLPKDA